MVKSGNYRADRDRDGCVAEALRNEKLELPHENVNGHTHKLAFFLDKLCQIKNEKGDVSVIDVGCGNGKQVTRYFSAFSPRVLGLDLYEPCIEYANRNFGSDRLEFRTKLLHEVEGLFDVVVMSDVLEHVDDPAGLLAEASKRLKPDGDLLVSVPNGVGPFEREVAFSETPFIGPLLLRATDLFVALLDKTILRNAWTRLVDREPPPYNLGSPHVQFFRYRDMEKLFADAGYEIVDQINLAFLSGPFTNYLAAPWTWALRLNLAIGHRVPKEMASAWCFHLRRRPAGP